MLLEALSYVTASEKVVCSMTSFSAISVVSIRLAKRPEK